MLSSVHVGPMFTIPPGIVLFGMLVWYWRQLGRPEVPSSRRSIRRMATVLMLMTVPLLVLGMSVHDPYVDQRGYVLTWTAVMGLILLLVVLATIDVLNNLRLHHRRLTDEIIRSLEEIAKAEQPAREHESTPAAENGVS